MVEQVLQPTPAFATGGPTDTKVTIADIAERTVPSVVNIWATKTVRRPDFSPFSHDPFLKDFFGRQFFERVPRERKQRSLGSGVIASVDGVILTNTHVIEDAEDVQVTLSDGRDFKAEIVGSDSRSDVAVLRL